MGRRRSWETEGIRGQVEEIPAQTLGFAAAPHVPPRAAEYSTVSRGELGESLWGSGGLSLTSCPAGTPSGPSPLPASIRTAPPQGSHHPQVPVTTTALRRTSDSGASTSAGFQLQLPLLGQASPGSTRGTHQNLRAHRLGHSADRGRFRRKLR